MMSPTKPPVNVGINLRHPDIGKVIAYYPCNEGAGGTINDVGPNSIHLYTPSAGATTPEWVGGKYGPQYKNKSTANYGLVSRRLTGVTFSTFTALVVIEYTADITSYGWTFGMDLWGTGASWRLSTEQNQGYGEVWDTGGSNVGYHGSTYRAFPAYAFHALEFTGTEVRNYTNNVLTGNPAFGGIFRQGNLITLGGSWDGSSSRDLNISFAGLFYGTLDKSPGGLWEALHDNPFCMMDNADEWNSFLRGIRS